LKCLEEEALDVEERVRLCESDARQLLDVRPVLAWSRAQQAVALLGEEGGKFSVSDPEARKSAYLTLCRVALHLGLRRVNLPMELGPMNLFGEASGAAERAGRQGLADLLGIVGLWARNFSEDRSAAVYSVASAIRRGEKEVDNWLAAELEPCAAEWIRLLEGQADKVPTMVYLDLPVLYRLFLPAKAEERTARLRDKAIRGYLEMRDYGEALRLVHEMAHPDAKLIAACHEGMGELELAAGEFLKTGSPSDALRCYRRIPDFDKTLDLLKTMPDHPARESLEWLRRMRDLAAERPPEFGKQVLPEEKKLLEHVLEASLGASRKKPAAKKKAAAAPRKRARPGRTVERLQPPF
jgi:hypothetical protein